MNDAASELEWGRPSQHANVARDGCILRTVVGSQLHGVVRAGTDDRDEMAIYIEPPDYVVGLKERKHCSHRTQPEGVQSGPGDLDLIAYSLRRYCELAMKGSPTVLLPLFAPPEHTLICTELGAELRHLAEDFISESTKASFLGYLESQKKGLLGSGGKRERELSEEHGYDTKYAMHALRIGYQGIELFQAQTITLPVPEPQRSRLMEVRLGEVALNDILAELDDLIGQLSGMGILVMNPPPELVLDQWLVSAYRRHWDEIWRPVGLE